MKKPTSPRYKRLQDVPVGMTVRSNARCMKHGDATIDFLPSCADLPCVECACLRTLDFPISMPLPVSFVLPSGPMVPGSFPEGRFQVVQFCMRYNSVEYAPFAWKRIA